MCSILLVKFKLIIPLFLQHQSITITALQHVRETKGLFSMLQIKYYKKKQIIRNIFN